MRQELIQQTQEDPSHAGRLSELEKHLRDIDMAIGQVRIYLLVFHRTLASANDWNSIVPLVLVDKYDSIIAKNRDRVFGNYKRSHPQYP